ncbi:hypothetical protein BCR39DRAFT_292721 [Naematelia encephala]|uniref:Uncharacterized protein n=1 Tax=Naematelia encephala TaxID=71784 RepID=A0A1Y2ARS9_9TREE|nr:hypothetical protein BCR39DRAFT_292721 [Naematelia encephala]
MSRHYTTGSQSIGSGVDTSDKRPYENVMVGSHLFLCELVKNPRTISFQRDTGDCFEPDLSADMRAKICEELKTSDQRSLVVKAKSDWTSAMSMQKASTYKGSREISYTVYNEISDRSDIVLRSGKCHENDFAEKLSELHWPSRAETPKIVALIQENTGLFVDVVYSIMGDKQKSLPTHTTTPSFPSSSAGPSHTVTTSDTTTSDRPSSRASFLNHFTGSFNSDQKESPTPASSSRGSLKRSPSYLARCRSFVGSRLKHISQPSK